MLAHSILDLIGGTPLVELKRLQPKRGVRVFAKLEGQNPTGSVKDRIARRMVEKAEEEGRIHPGDTLLEPTSGNTGISLAFVGRMKGYKVKVVMPENVSQERTQLLQAYGAEVAYSPGAEGSNGAILVAKRLAEEHPDYFMPFQYGNAANPEAHYLSTGPEVLRDLPDTDVFVAGLGTGGTLMGTGRYLKEKKPGVKVVAVAPEVDDAIAGLRVLEQGFVPPILDLTLLDSRILVRSEESFRYTKLLLHREGIFAGISAGAAVACAMRLAERMDRGNIVCLLADGGWKYLSTGLWSRDYPEMERDVKGKIWW